MKHSGLFKAKSVYGIYLLIQNNHYVISLYSILVNFEIGTHLPKIINLII